MSAREQRIPGLGILVTLATLLVVEAFSRFPFPAPQPLPTMLLLLALAVVVYATFRDGLAAGLVAALLLGGYTLHWISTDAGIVTTRDGLLGGAIMLALGVVLAIVVFLLKRRADEAADRMLRQEQDALMREREHGLSLKDANRALQRANDTLEAFSYVVSHDLKEPVRAIHAFLDSIEQEHGKDLTPPVADLVRRADEATSRLNTLMLGLLEVSRASRLDVSNAGPVDVQRVLQGEGCRMRFQRVLDERHARLEVAQDLPRVLATGPALDQVFGNLVLNAVKHNPRSDALVRVSSREHPTDRALVEILVEDNGPGFRPDVARMFDDGAFRLPPDRSMGGFGLLIVQRAIERLGGRLAVGRSDLGGAAVRVALPRA